MRSDTSSSMATLANRYRVNPSWKRTGGMGVVYRAWDLLDQCYVVIKSPMDHHHLKVDRFLRELSVMRRIDDPHVIQVKDSGVFGEVPFAVFPYLAGGDLQRRLPRSRGNRVPAPAEALKPWLVTIATALDRVHQKGFIHRDVKPGNILFDGCGVAYLGDFGLAHILRQYRTEEDQTITTDLQYLGTPGYVDPQTLLGKNPTTSSDQFSLAAVVYELLAGRKINQPTNLLPAVLAAQNFDPPNLGRSRPDLPPSLCDAVHRALQAHPQFRFDSCSDFAACVLADIPDSPEPQKMRVACPACDTLLVVADSQIGTPCRCPNKKCERTVRASEGPFLILPEDMDSDDSAPNREKTTTLEAENSFPGRWNARSPMSLVSAASLCVVIGCAMLAVAVVLRTVWNRERDLSSIHLKPLQSEADPVGDNAEPGSESMAGLQEISTFSNADIEAQEDSRATEDSPTAITVDEIHAPTAKNDKTAPESALDQIQDAAEEEREIFIDQQQRHERNMQVYDDWRFHAECYAQLARDWDRQKAGWADKAMLLGKKEARDRELVRQIDQLSRDILHPQNLDNADRLHELATQREKYLFDRSLLKRELLDLRNAVHINKAEQETLRARMKTSISHLVGSLEALCRETRCFSRDHRTARNVLDLRGILEDSRRDDPSKQAIKLQDDFNDERVPLAGWVDPRQDINWIRKPLPVLVVLCHLEILENDLNAVHANILRCQWDLDCAERDLASKGFSPAERRAWIWPLRCFTAYAMYLSAEVPKKEQHPGHAIRRQVLVEERSDGGGGLTGVSRPLATHPATRAIDALSYRLDRRSKNERECFLAFWKMMIPSEDGFSPRWQVPRTPGDGPPTPVVAGLIHPLMAEAAWYFANQKRGNSDLAFARNLVSELIPDDTSVSWLGWRSKALLAAKAAEWPVALECIERSIAQAPLGFQSDLNLEKQSYEEGIVPSISTVRSIR